MAEKVSYQTYVTRDLSIAGSQKITLPFKAKSIQINATVVGTSYYSNSFCDESLVQRCIYNYSENGVIKLGSIQRAVRYTSDNSNVTDGIITLIENDGITINWTKTNAGATGTVLISILATTH